MKLLEPETIIQGRYRVRELIGKGGMGQVYSAVDQRLGHSVALKRTTVGDDPSLADAFENEARTLAQLRHPFLPKVSDHFVEGEEQFLVMEYIAGDDLSQRLKSLNKPFPLNWVLFWADEILETLCYLHTHDPPIIHRDIKPQNLKLTNDNHIVLLDFGLSKHSVSHTKVTTSGSVVGYTPHYAPMEQIRGTGTSALSDIYALSATLYHLLSNRVPPDALTRADALLADQPDPLRPLTELNGEVSEIISDTIQRGMELNQDKRFPSAREMQKKLRKAYNELQQSMSAETVAFNVADLEGSDDGIAGEKTEVILGGIPGFPEPAGTPSQPAAFDADKAEMIDAGGRPDIAEPEPDSDIGDKTEVMSEIPVYVEEEPSTEDLPSAPPGMGSYETSEDLSDASESAGEFATSEDFAADDYASDDRDDEAGGLDATVAGIGIGESLRDGGTFTGFSADQESNEASDADAPESSGFTEEFSAGDVDGGEADEPEEEKAPESVVTAAAAGSAQAGQGSSTGKYIGILLGLAAVLILVLGSALAAGWYFLSGGIGGGDQTPDPTPAVTPFDEITPEITPEVTPVESPELTPEELPSPVEEATPGGSTTTPTPRRTPGRTPVRTPAKTPVRTPPPTPKPTPKKTPRTLPTILQ